jgi:hypothetical protein
VYKDSSFARLDLEPEESEKQNMPAELFEEPKESDREDDEMMGVDLIGDVITQISSETGGPTVEDSLLPNFRANKAGIDGVTPDNSDWFPFLNKEVSRKI